MAVSILFLSVGALGSAVFEIAIGHVPDGFFIFVMLAGMVTLPVAIAKRDSLDRAFRYSGREDEE